VEVFLLLSIFDIQVYYKFHFFISRICSVCCKTVSCVIFVKNCDT
jgi:hypothetical protein